MLVKLLLEWLICLTIWKEIDSTSFLTTEYQNVCIFWRDNFFKKSSNKYCFHMVYQWTCSSEYPLFFTWIFCLSAIWLFNLNLSTSSLLLNLIFVSIEPWIFSYFPPCFQISSYFPILFWMLQLQIKAIRLHKAKFNC